jgi:RNA polymerase sigma factor (sigma-70 family)
MKSQSSAKRDTFAKFPSTSWTLIRMAQHESGEVHRSLLGELLRRYWKPIYAFFRKSGKSPEDARDLTQGFLTQFWEDDGFQKIRDDQRSFRAWFQQCAMNFLKSDWRRQHAAKRHPVQGIVSFDALCFADGEPYDAEGDSDIDDSYEEAWRRQVLDNAFRRLRELCDTESRQDHHSDRLQDIAIFEAYYCNNDEGHVTWEMVADRFGLKDWKIAARKADWVKEKLRQAIHDELRTLYGDDTEQGLVELLS